MISSAGNLFDGSFNSNGNAIPLFYETPLHEHPSILAEMAEYELQLKAKEGDIKEDEFDYDDCDEKTRSKRKYFNLRLRMAQELHEEVMKRTSITPRNDKPQVKYADDIFLPGLEPGEVEEVYEWDDESRTMKLLPWKKDHDCPTKQISRNLDNKLSRQPFLPSRIEEKAKREDYFLHYANYCSTKRKPLMGKIFNVGKLTRQFILRR